MPGHKIRRLTSPDVLRQIEADRLLQLLARFSSYFEEAGLPLPAAGADILIERLAVLLADAQKDAPPGLIDALFLIDQMATKSGCDAVRRMLADSGHALAPAHDHSPADVATEAWLRDPRLLSRAYASQLSTRSRTLQLLLASDGVTIIAQPGSDDVRLRVRSEIAARLAPDADVEVYAFPYAGGVRFVVQRGGSFERYGAWNHGSSPTTVGYQPLEYCVVVFDAARLELAVPKEPARVHQALREAFSLGLAGELDAFSRRAILDLSPIRSSREGCLWCRDVPGIRHVVLRGIRYSIQPALKHSREERATDLFRAWEVGHHQLPHGLLLRAEFEFQFDDCLAPRSVTLSSGASIRLARDDDSELVNDWMRRRGFVLGAGDSASATGDLWSWLDRPDSWLATAPEWERRLGAQHDAALPLLRDARATVGAIRRQSDGAEVDVVPDGSGGHLLVHGASDGIAGADPMDTALWRIEMAAVARAVAIGAGLHGAVGQLDEAPEAWSLGEFIPIAGERFPVYFVAVGGDDELRRVCAVIAGLSARPFVLITPSRRFATPRCNDRLGAGTAGWLALNECARVDGTGEIRFRQPLDMLLRPFLATYLPDSFGQPRRPRFPTPPGVGWGDIRIRFTDAHTVNVQVRDRSQSYTYEGMGMRDKRTPRPTLQWQLLHTFAKEGGSLTWGSSDASSLNQKRRERLADDLRAFFAIDSDPFEYDDNLRGWRARFTIEPD